MQARHSLRESDERLKLAHGVAIALRALRAGRCLSHLLELFLEDHGGVSAELRLERSADLDVSLELRHRELWLQSGVLEAMHLDDMARNLEVIFILLFIEDDEEKIEARHDRSRDIHIVSKRLSPIIPTT